MQPVNPVKPVTPVTPNPQTNEKTLSAYNRNGQVTNITVESNGNSGMVFPKINGRLCTQMDYLKFNFEISKDGGKTFKDISTEYTNRGSSSYSGGNNMDSGLMLFQQEK